MIDMYRYTDKELKELLKSMIVLVDTREQNWLHIQKFFDEKKIPYRVEKLDFADYSFLLPENKELGIQRDIYFDKKISIERKRDLNEISSNFCDGRTQFENEFIRSMGKLYLLIENATYEDIVNKNYTTKITPQSFIGSLHAFVDRYNISLNFMKDNSYSAYFIYLTFYHHLRNYLMNK